MTTRRKLLTLNALLLLVLGSLVCCRFDGTLHTEFRYVLPQSERLSSEKRGVIERQDERSRRLR